MSNLTVIILTKNEEQNIEEVVRNAQQVTDNVLVVDSGSTDRTVEIAEKLGSRVVYRAWDNDFSSQRNFALEQIDTDWVLYLDADERLNDELVNAVKVAVDLNVARKYFIKRKTVAFGHKFNYGVLKPDYVGRMFMRKGLKWVNKVHESAVCEEGIKDEMLTGYVEHYPYIDWHHNLGKLNQYTSIWAENAFSNGKRTGYCNAFMHAILAFVKMYVLKLGFLDGWPGLVMCCNHWFYTLYKYVKLVELQEKNK